MHPTPPFATNSARVNDRSQRLLRLLCACLLLIGVAGVPNTAGATCWFTSGVATTVTFNAGTITLTPSTTVGAVLWTSNTASPANPPVLDCDGNTNGGIVNIIAASTSVNGDNTLIPTGIPGISYRLLHPNASTLLALYPNYPVGSGSSTYSVTTNLQLVYTGPYLPPNNSTMTGQLSQWQIDICDKPTLFLGIYLGCGGSVAARPVETFNISAIIKIQVPTCNLVGPADFTVTADRHHHAIHGSGIGADRPVAKTIQHPVNGLSKWRKGLRHAQYGQSPSGRHGRDRPGGRRFRNRCGRADPPGERQHTRYLWYGDQHRHYDNQQLHRRPVRAVLPNGNHRVGRSCTR
jgi:hypothetical protein